MLAISWGDKVVSSLNEGRSELNPKSALNPKAANQTQERLLTGVSKPFSVISENANINKTQPPPKNSKRYKFNDEWSH
jgi:hypothetical protein